MDLETINVEKIEKVAIIKLNRPELLNAVNEQLVWDFQKSCIWLVLLQTQAHRHQNLFGLIQ